MLSPCSALSWAWRRGRDVGDGCLPVRILLLSRKAFLRLLSVLPSLAASGLQQQNTKISGPCRFSCCICATTRAEGHLPAGHTIPLTTKCGSKRVEEPLNSSPNLYLSTAFPWLGLRAHGSSRPQWPSTKPWAEVHMPRVSSEG